MTNYNERLDEVLDNFLDGTDARLTEIGWERYAENVAEAKLALTKLTEEVVDEVIGKDHLDFTVEDLYADNWIFLNEQKAEQRTTKTKLLRGEL